jgi:hypothetical protein
MMWGERRCTSDRAFSSDSSRSEWGLSALPRSGTSQPALPYYPKRVTENGVRSTLDWPLAISSAIDQAVMGAIRMPVR